MDEYRTQGPENGYTNDQKWLLWSKDGYANGPRNIGTLENDNVMAKHMSLMDFCIDLT
jgi:hypothetical protein